MAAIHLVFKINSKLHTQVGQDTNESVDKGLHAIFYQPEWWRKLSYSTSGSFSSFPGKGTPLSMHTESSMKEVHVNV